MKYLVISDIHGDIENLKKALAFFEKKKCDKILIGGDELYHGPRNSIPEHYDPKEVAKLLNTYKDKIVACRGNCEAEVDQMLLEYPVMDDYQLVDDIFLTHGHIYNEDMQPDGLDYKLMITGHTHIPVLKEKDGIIFLNPGSITFPKNNSSKSLAIVDEEYIEVIDLNGSAIMSLNRRK